MMEIDAATGTLAVPIWVVGAASAVFVASIALAIVRAGVATSLNVLSRVGVVAVVVSAGWFYIQRAEQREHAAERRLFDERSAALLARAVAPGSALSCLDELAGDTVEIACEKAVFASPETIAAAVAYINAKLTLLVDGDDLTRRVDAAFAANLAPLRAALELDRFGIVAQVLATRYGCTADNCDVLTRFGDRSRVLANLTDHLFDEQVTKFAAIWNAPPRAAPDGAAAVASTAALPQNLSPAPVMVSPRYDFPSSQSIPPINIMVPELTTPRVNAAPNGPSAAPPGDGNSRTGTAPVPPRRPPQGRPPSVAAGSRPSNPQPAVPIAGGEVPTDGAVRRPSGSVQPQ